MDFEGVNPTLDVTVAVDDPSVGVTPDDSEALSISVTDVNEVITNGNSGGTMLEHPAMIRSMAGRERCY
jgi:hypothetical protein